MSHLTDHEKPASAPVGGFARMRGRLVEYARLMRLDRPIGIWLLLWPALWALWISADGHPDEVTRKYQEFMARKPQAAAA